MEDKQQQPIAQGETGEAAPDLSRIDQITMNQSLDAPVTVSESLRPSGAQPEVSSSDFQPQRMWWKKLLIPALIVLVLAGGFAAFSISRNKPEMSLKAGSFDSIKVPLGETSPDDLETTGQLKVNGQLQVSSSLILRPSTPPVGAVAGQIFYDQANNQIAFYNGTEFINLVGTTSTNAFIQNTTTINNFTSNITNATAGVTTPSGTPGSILKFTSAQTVGDSIATDKNTYLQINGGINIVASTSISNLSFWNDSTVPGTPNVVDPTGPIELGMKFQTDVSGVVNGVRFYRGTTNNGPYVGSLWSSTGALLAQVTFGSVNSTGWQEASFASPIPVSPDTTYVVSYHHANGGYSADVGYFKSVGVDNGPIHALASGIDGPNGVFKYSGVSTFPNEGFNSTNYWVDVDFSGATYTTDSRIRINGAQLSSSDLVNDANIAKRTSSQIFSGYNTFRATSNAADAFSVQRSDTTPVFTVDTDGQQIVIGRGVGDGNGTILVLGKRVSVGDPGGVEGAIYYNNAQQSFRCYRNSTWENCAQPEVDRSFSQYEEFLGNQNTSFATNNFGSLGWRAFAIGANGTVSFDPSTPTPVDDRPGVMAIQTPAVINQGSTLLLGSGSGSILLSKNNIVKTAVALSTTTQVVRVGLHSETTGTARPISGVWWEADASVNANWQYCSGDGATATCTATAVPIAANTWVRLELRVLATGTGTSSFSAAIDGAFFSRSLITIDSTNRVSPALSCYTATAAAESCYWDYYQLKGTTNAAR